MVVEDTAAADHDSYIVDTRDAADVSDAAAAEKAKISFMYI